MPRRFLNSTETALVSLVKRVMQRHKPYGPGLRRSFINFVRSFSVGSKPRDAHSLSVLVTEDLLVEITKEFDSADISSSFVNVMSLADEEVLGHYSRPGRSPFFASMLTELLEGLKASSSYYNEEWDLSFFQGFVSRYLVRHKEELSNDHLNQALEILISPGHYRLLSVNWLLLRFLAAGYVEVARGASGVAQGFVASDSSRAGASLGSVFTSRYDNVDNDRDTADAVHNSEALYSMRGSGRSQRFGLLFVLPERESLKCMLEDEVEAMMSLYSLVLFSQYVNEEYQTSKTSFKEAHPTIAWVLQKCGALVGSIGFASMVFYMGSMVGSILAQLSGEIGASPTGEVSVSGIPVTATTTFVVHGNSYESFKKSYVGNMNSEDHLKDLCINFLKYLIRGKASTESELLRDILTNATAPKLSNYSAMPASMSVLLVMYLSIPLTMFGGFASKWISSKIESRGGAQFVRPNLLSPIVVTQGFKLVMNTLLTGTAHVENKAANAILSWTVKRLYLPFSLTEQPAKTTNFLNAALAASPTNRHRRVALSTKKCIIATLASFPFEYAVHTLANIAHVSQTQAVHKNAYKAVATVLSAVLKSARIGGLFGPSVYARRYTPDDYAYSSYFEQLLWIDGVKAITAPAMLIGYDYATSPLASTVVLTLDSLVSFIPDISCGIRYDMLNKTASKLTALNTWLYRNNLSSQEVLKLATMATLEDVPGAAQASLMYMLEKRLKKNIVQDLGMDLILDSPEQEGEELEEEIEEQEGRTFPTQASRVSSDRTPATLSTAHGRSTESSNRKQRVEEIELTDLRPQQPVRRNNREARTAEELEPLQRGLTLGDFKSRRAANRQQQEGTLSSIKSKMFEGAEALMQKVRPPVSSEQQGGGRIYLGVHDSDEEISDSGFYPPSDAISLDDSDHQQWPRDGVTDSVPRYAQDSTRSSVQRFNRPKGGAGKHRPANHSGPSYRNDTFAGSTSNIFLSPTGESPMMGISCSHSLFSRRGTEDVAGSSVQRFNRPKGGAGKHRPANHSGPSYCNDTFAGSTSNIFLSPTGESPMMGISCSHSLFSRRGTEDVAGKKPVKHVSFDKPYTYQSCNSTDSSDDEEQYQGENYEDVGLEEEDSYEEECNVVSTPHSGDVRKRRSRPQQESCGTHLTDIRVTSGAYSSREHVGQNARRGERAIPRHHNR